MRIVLVDPTLPWWRGARSRWAPLGLAYLAAVLRREGHQVWLHNRLAVQTRKRLELQQLDAVTFALLREARPDLVGISGPTASYPDIRAVAQLARAVLPDARIVLGGPHATIVPRETLERIPEADCLVVGEGERVLAEMAAGRPAAECAGVVWREDGATRQNPWQRPEWELDGLPFPARDLLDMEWYTGRDSSGVVGSAARSLTMITSRGCSHRCAFCAEPAWTVRGLRFHSPEHSVVEAERILADYPVEALVFLDEMFTANAERVAALTDLWQARGLHERARFSIQARADALDPETLRRLKAAGCYQIEIGVESGSDRVLESMLKGVTVEENRRAVQAVKAAGIRAQVNIMAGSPDETEEELLSSLRFVEETQPDALSLTHFIPIPGTEFVRRLIEAGRLAADYWAVEERRYLAPRWDFTAMRPGRLEGLFERGRRLSRAINHRSWLAQVPWWRGWPRRAALVLGRVGLERRRFRKRSPMRRA